MSEAKTIPHWLYQVLGWIATFVAGGGAYKLFNKLLAAYWKKPQAEVHKTDAETAEIVVRTHSQVVKTQTDIGDAVVRMVSKLEETQELIDEIRDENIGLKMQVAQLETQVRSNEYFIARLHAGNKLGLQLADLPPTLKEVIQMLEQLDDHKKE